MKKKQNGFSMIELLVVLIIVGIMAGIAMQSMTSTVATTKVEETKAELDRIAFAIAGNPSMTSSGGRTDFGYVGDIGSLPPNLTALFTNPGAYGTWQGPYLYDELSTDGNGTSFLTDAWGAAYTYNGGVTIASNGGGSSIHRTIAASSDDLLRNRVIVNVTDRLGTPPGSEYDDSVKLVLAIPNGSGSITNKSKFSSASGVAVFDSIPIGNHLLMLVDIGTNDTLRRRVSVGPGSEQSITFPTYQNGWGSTFVTYVQDTIRPTAAGTYSQFTPSGAAANWDCVNDASSDGDGTSVVNTGNAKYDTYDAADPSVSSGTIDSFNVYYTVKQTSSNAYARASIRISSKQYNGSMTNLNSVVNYTAFRHKFTTNPSTGLAWTFGQIQGLQLGIRGRRAQVTQLYGVLYVSQ